MQAPVANQWKLKTQTLSFQDGPAIMGILNATPDSFSDGGKHHLLDHAVRQGIKLASLGAAIIDIGGESTRPYSEPVSKQEELDRTIPVIEKLSSEVSTPISIDTSKSIVADEALKAGAEIINDVTGLEGDANMISVAKKYRPGICAMHMQGTPQTMQDDPSYSDVVAEIGEYLESRKQFLITAGLDSETICLDPGIGFGKTHNHNWKLLQSVSQFHSLNCPILVGHSRKGFIGELQQDKSLERDAATAGITVHLYLSGIQVIRVHDVGTVNRCLNAFQKCHSV